MTICVILLNSLVMMMDDPTAEPSPTIKVIEDVFVVFYTVEMILKIVGLGLIFGEDAYLKDASNWLDGFVVIMSYPEYFTNTGVVDETSTR